MNVEDNFLVKVLRGGVEHVWYVQAAEPEVRSRESIAKDIFEAVADELERFNLKAATPLLNQVGLKVS